MGSSSIAQDDVITCNAPEFTYIEHRPSADKENDQSFGQGGAPYSDKMDVLRIVTIIALVLTYSGSQIPHYFTGPSLDYVSADLHIGVDRSWIVSTLNLATACVVPVAGYLEDLIGRRGMLAFGFLCVIAGTIVFAIATTFAELLVGGVLMGVGGGIEELTAVAAIAELVPARLRGNYFGFMIAVSILFTPSLIYAGELSTHTSWRWLFWICLIFNGSAILLTVVSYFTVKIDRASTMPTSVTLREVDYIGTILFMVGVTELPTLVALEAGGITHPWKSAYVLAQLLVGIGLLAMFIFWESRGYGHPLIPFRLFKGQRVVAVTFIICFFSTPTYSVVLNLSPTIITSVYQKSSLEVGLIALGPSLCLALGATLSNVLISVSRGYVREFLVVFLIFMSAFMAACAVINPTNYVVWAVLGSFASLGIGGALVSLPTLASLACPQDLIGTAVALTIFLRTLGGVVGYAIFYNIYVSRLESRIGPVIGAAVAKAGLPRDQIESFVKLFVEDVAASNPISNLHVNQTILQASYRSFAETSAQAASVMYLATIAFSGTALLAALCLPNIGQYLTGRVIARTAFARPGQTPTAPSP